MSNPVILYGATGHAAAVREEVEQILADRDLRVIAYIDDNPETRPATLGGLPVIDFETWQRSFRDVPVNVTIGTPAHRRRLVARIEAAGGRFAWLIGAWPSLARDLVAGEGSFIGGGCYVGPGVRIGRHVQIQPLSCIGHETTIGDYTTICSARIAGWVEIGSDVFIGIGTSIVHGNAARPLRIGDGAFIAAGSVITRPVPPGARVMGNPARPLRELARRNGG